MQSPEKPWLMQCLNSFFNFVKDICKRKPATTLHDLLNTITLMQKGKLEIPLYKVTANDDGVNLITAHSSKGSEYAHVFVVGCTDKIWDDKKGSNRNYAYPNNLLSNNNTASDLEESRRLFYVAITRAKTNLSVSYAAKDRNDKPQIKSTFVTEILEGIIGKQLKLQYRTNKWRIILLYNLPKQQCLK